MNHNLGPQSEHSPSSATPSQWADGTVVGSLISRGAEPPTIKLNPESKTGRVQRIGAVESDLLATSRGRGNYRVQGEIGRDALSYVLKVEDTDLGRFVAMKVLRDEHMQNPRAMTAFAQEAQVAAQLQHEGILPVYDFGLHPDGRPYYTMKLVTGESLASLLASRKSIDAERRRFLSIFEQVCKAMAYAHSRGVAHRALDPRHVIVGAQGETQVVHWASSRFLVEDADGAPLTPIPIAAPDNFPHMAPEAARGDFEACDERTDVFALGSILCEILTGSPAYVGGSAQDVRAMAGQGRLDDAQTRLDRCEGRLELVALAKRCLVAGQSGRPQSALDVATDLNLSLLSQDDRRGQAEFSAQVAIDRAEREHRTARKSRILAEAVMLVGMLGVAGAYFHYDQKEEQRAAVLASVQQEVECAQFLWRQAQAEVGKDTSLWDEAMLAIGRASSHLMVPGIDDSVKKRVEFVAENLRVERLEALERVQRTQRDEAILAALGSAAVAHGERLTTRDYALLASRNAEIFSAQKLNPQAGQEEAVAQAIQESSIPVEILTAFDRWAVACIRSGQDKAEILLDVASRADGDPVRNALRDALRSKDRRFTLQAVASINLLEVDPQTAVLAAATLRMHKLGDKAIEVLQAAYRNAPGDFTLNFELAEAYEAEGESGWSQAVRFYTSALGHRPESVDTRYRLSRALEHEGHLNEAMAILQRAAADNPNDARLQAHLGSLQLGLGDRQLALQMWRRALDSDGVEPSGLAILGEDLRSAGDLQGARIAFSKWVDRAATDPQAHVALGRLLREQGQLEEAARELALATQLDETWAYSRIELGDLYVDMEQNDKAIESYFAALRLQPNDASLQRKIGSAFEARNEWDSAAVAFKDSLVLDGSHEGTAERLFVVLTERLDSSDAAVEAFQDVTQAQPDSAIAWYYLARSEMGRRDLGASVAALQTCIELRPEEARSRVLLGRAELELGNMEEAVAELRKVVALEPEVARAHSDLGVALSRAGQLDGAVDALRRAIELEPTNPDVHYRLGSALQRRGDLDDARVSYMETIRLRPTHAEAHCNLGGLFKLQGDYVASLEVYRIGHELGSGRTGWAHPSNEWVAEAERLVAAQDQLDAVVKGAQIPDEPETLVQLASMAQRQGLNGTSARLFESAIERSAMTVGKIVALDGYQAASAAIQAGCATGGDSAAMSEEERARWRATGLGWLERELISLLASVEDGRLAEQELQDTLRRWAADPVFAPIRDETGLALLPEAERAPLLTFWGRIATLARK